MGYVGVTLGHTGVTSASLKGDLGSLKGDFGTHRGNFGVTFIVTCLFSIRSLLILAKRVNVPLLANANLGAVHNDACLIRPQMTFCTLSPTFSC